MDFKLIASTIGTDTDNDAFTSPEKQWLERTRAYPVARLGRLSFLVFEITCNYWLDDRYFVGLDAFEIETGLIVAGRVEDFIHAAKAIPREADYDIRSFFNYVKQKCRDFGYEVCSSQ